ncbi:hypothetical protein NEOLEDRAFT_1148058 [Neolentinus lepideus HHB14362 ss-1]|uniref:CHAT domain-containing protein n=1 Tax=Neolentinus lepideus HHB14362 ss-1 TaxID=1314782 RepID=A0A165SNQ8_9AGAM|nr:hypothetical protein NEOLEDRAFT_1148058 [Neolentinus lepideus HHB14362 ss-1]
MVSPDMVLELRERMADQATGDRKVTEEDFLNEKVGELVITVVQDLQANIYDKLIIQPESTIERMLPRHIYSTVLSGVIQFNVVVIAIPEVGAFPETPDQGPVYGKRPNFKSTKLTVIEILAPSFWPHLAFHGAKIIQTRKCGIFMADGQQPRLSDLVRPSMTSAPLVFLSACQTGATVIRILGESFHFT